MRLKFSEMIFACVFSISAFFLIIFLYNKNESFLNKESQKKEEIEPAPSKEDKFLTFISGKDKERDLEYYSKTLSWIVVAGTIMAIGVAISTKSITVQNLDNSRNLITGLTMSLIGAILGLLYSLRIVLAPFPSHTKNNLSISKMIGSFIVACIFFWLLINFLKNISLFQEKKILSLSSVLCGPPNTQHLKMATKTNHLGK